MQGFSLSYFPPLSFFLFIKNYFSLIITGITPTNSIQVFFFSSHVERKIYISQWKRSVFRFHIMFSILLQIQKETASQTVNQTDRQVKGLRKGYLLDSALKSPMNTLDNFFGKFEKQKDR